jgi:hypothetical protein
MNNQLGENKMNRYIRMVKQFVLDPKVRFGYLTRAGFYNHMSDEEYLSRKYQLYFGQKLDLQNPQTFNEKLQWLKLYNRKPEYTVMVDKYKVREYIAQELGEEYLIPLLGVWDNPDEIDFDALPNQFVLKCNHNSGLGMCICKDKSELDISKVKVELRKGLKQDYYLTGREWPYKDVPRKIIAEKYMEDVSGDLKDYKFYCFNGEMKFVMINSDRNTSRPTRADYFDRDFNWLDFTWGYSHAEVHPKKPEQFEKMVAIVEKLAKGLPHIRVDLYDCNGKIYFGELTFFDGSGFDKIEPLEWDYKIGKLLKLPTSLKY